MVKAGYIFEGTHYSSHEGTPQGSVVSPMFANIYLNELDKFMIQYKSKFDLGLTKKKNKAFRNRKNKSVKELRKLNIISTDLADKEFRRLYYIRYADDFIVGIDSDISTAKNVSQDIVKFISDELKMDLKQQQIINYRHERAMFLGFIIKGTAFQNRPIRTNIKGVKYRVTPRPVILIPMERILLKLKEKGFVKRGKNNEFKPTSLRRLVNHPIYNIIEYFNSIYRGLAYYYSIATFRSPLRDLNYVLKISCALTIALKMKLKTIRKVMKVYGRNLICKENKATISFIK
jgi:hypothetical protein